MCKTKNPNEVQVVMAGHDMSICNMAGRFIKTWEVNNKFKRQWIIDWLRIEELEPNDVSYIVFPWLEELRSEKSKVINKTISSKYDIWAEGYACTGERAGASCLGHSKGTSFLEACRNMAEINLDFKKYYDERNGAPCHWGCRLFDNQADAIKSFG